MTPGKRFTLDGHWICAKIIGSDWAMSYHYYVLQTKEGGYIVANHVGDEAGLTFVAEFTGYAKALHHAVSLALG